MRRSARLQSARSWLSTYPERGPKIVKAYRKRYGVDWPTAFRELAVLGVEVSEDYKAEVLRNLQRQAEIKQQNKAEKERLERGYDQDDYFAMIIGYTSGGAPYGITWEEWEEFNASEDDLV